jgi:hypothetical protein
MWIAFRTGRFLRPTDSERITVIQITGIDAIFRTIIDETFTARDCVRRAVDV